MDERLFAMLNTRQSLQESLSHTYVDSRRKELRNQIEALDREIEAWREEREAMQRRLF